MPGQETLPSPSWLSFGDDEASSGHISVHGGFMTNMDWKWIGLYNFTHDVSLEFLEIKLAPFE